MLSCLKSVYGKALFSFNRFFLFLSDPPKNLVRKILFILLPLGILLALIPIINIAHIIATSGENNLSNDVVFWADLVDKVLNRQVTLSEFLNRSFLYQHFVILHLMTEMLNVYLFGWNIYITLFFGFLLNVIKLFLLFDLFTFRYSKNPFRWVLLPVLAALVFSNMEVTTFTGQNAATLIGMSLFGAILSIWGIARFPERVKGVLICVLGGFISTWTFALGLAAWPVTLLGMILLGYRNVKHYLMWLAGVVVSIFPYWYFLYFKPVNGAHPVHLNLATVINLPFLLNMMGRPLVNLWTFDFTKQYKLVGAMGFALAFVCLVLFAFHFRKNNFKILISAMMVIALGLGSVWLTSIGRSSLASWYITAAWPFWQGITGFAFLLLLEPVAPGSSYYSVFGLIKKFSAVFILLILGLLYARSNIGNEVYGFILYSRTPASVSCLRNYEYAPVYCESFLFQWPMQRPYFIYELGRPLGKNQLSANGRQQQWSLQGDFIFNQVQVKRNADTDPIGWYEGLQGDRADWSGIKRWHHLDILLHAPNSVRWTVQFPDYLESAILKSSVGLRKGETNQPEEDGTTFLVTVQGEDLEKKVIFERSVLKDDHNWSPFSVDLSSYKGRKITIEFTSLPGKNNIADWAMYQYPVIDVKVAKHIDTEQNVPFTPENTDLNLDFKGPATGDIVWDGTDLNLFYFTNIEVVKDNPGFYQPLEDPQIQLRQPINVCFADYSYFYVKYALPKGTNDGTRVAKLYYQLNDNQPISEARSIQFSALADGKVHMQTYPLRLLDLDVGYNARITNIRFDPLTLGDSEDGPIQFVEMGLLRGENQGPSICR